MPQPATRYRQQDQASVAAHSPRSRYATRSRYSPHRPWLFLVREAAPAEDPYGSGSVDGKVDEAHPAPVPDPFTDADALEALEEEITVLAAHIHAATHRLLTLIADFDRRRGWELGGHRSAAHWLSFRTGVDLGTAREKVRTARALAGLPRTGEAMARGDLSFSQARALSRVATEENEAALLELARGCTTAQLERMVRGFRRGSREDEAEADERRHRSRTFSVFPDEDGMYVVRGRLPAEVGVLLMRAVEAAGDALYRASPNPLHSSSDSQRASAQRRADALGLLAERAMAAGFENGPVSGSRAERYQVVLHVDEETTEEGGGRSELEDGTRVSYETSRRISCDCGSVRVSHAPDGSILDVGRRTRTIPPALRRALEYRDRGCRFPGCGLRFTDAHHVRHWADGGETSLGNCALLCRHHHRLIHEGGWKMDWWGPGRPVFFDPRGGTHFDGRWKAPEEAREGSQLARPGGSQTGAGTGSQGPGPRPCVSAEPSFRNKSPRGVDSEAIGIGLSAEDRGQGIESEALVDDLLAENRRRGIHPDGWTPSARWKREADTPNRVLFVALEAIEAGGP